MPEEIIPVTTPVTTVAPQVTALDALVAAKGNESFRDPEVAAKSLLTANEHITSLERQLTEMRSDLSNRMSAEKALEAVNAKAEEIAAQVTRVATPEVEPTTGLDPEKVEAIVSAALEKSDTEKTHRDNANRINLKLQELYGDQAVAKVQERANELGMTVDQMVQTAKATPDAFMAMLNPPSNPETNAISHTQVNSASTAFSNTSERNYAFYDKIRKENPVAYFSPKTQKQMHKDALELGDKFLP